MLIDQLFQLDHKFSIVAAGCGAYFADPLRVPGCSQWLYNLHILYDEGLIQEYTQNYSSKFVSENMARSLAECTIVPDDVYVISLTAALPTSHERRGSNHAYCTLRLPDKTVYSKYLEFPKEIFDPNLQMVRRIECDRYFCEEALKWALSIIQTAK